MFTYSTILQENLVVSYFTYSKTTSLKQWLSNLKMHKHGGGWRKNDVDDRGSVHPSDDHIKVVLETRSEQQEKIAWDIDKQAIQLGRIPINHPAKAEDRTG